MSWACPACSGLLCCGECMPADYWAMQPKLVDDDDTGCAECHRPMVQGEPYGQLPYGDGIVEVVCLECELAGKVTP